MSASQYFKVDPRRITLREYWNISPSWKVLIPWIAGRLGVAMDFGSAFRHFASCRELLVEVTALSPEARATFEPQIARLCELGFHSPRFFVHENVKRDVRTSILSMIHRSGALTVRVLHSLGIAVTPHIENIVTVFLSELTDGTLLFSSNQKARFRPTPGTVTRRRLNAAPAELFELHQQSLAELGGGSPPKPLATIDAVDAAWDRNEQQALDFGRRRGLYVPVTMDEARTEQQAAETVAALQETGTPHAEVLVEVQRLQNKQGGWGNALLILILSLLLFIGAGAGHWSGRYLIMLVPILFFHELGHYVAMRLFRYRNLRMFFIPFFGAAVAGRHYNVPGWRKVIVSLMGPAPGILLGAGLTVAGLAWDQPALVSFALLALILNGFNLLPVLPLDGGWICHTLLFSRHHFLDAAFRSLAAVALFAGGLFSGDKVLLILSLPMLLGIPTAYRLARITHQLRRQGTAQISPDDQTMPTETGVAIVEALKHSQPSGYATATLARQTLQIFESLNARPPGWAATAGLLLTYAASLGLAVAFILMSMMGRSAAFRHYLDGKTQSHGKPTRAVACGDLFRWPEPGALDGPAASGRETVAHFQNRTVAQTAMSDLTNGLPPAGLLFRFGETVFVQLPAGDATARHRYLERLQGRTNSAFEVTSNTPGALALTGSLVTEELARDLEEELSDYLDSGLSGWLRPPWAAATQTTPTEAIFVRVARRTWRRALAIPGEVYATPEWGDYLRGMEEARRRGEKIDAKAANQQLRELLERLSRERLARLKQATEDPEARKIIDFSPSWWGWEDHDTNRTAQIQARRQLAHHLGSWTESERSRSAPAYRSAAVSGYVSRNGRSIEISGLTFRDLHQGSADLLAWLCRRGLAEMKYDIRPGYRVHDAEPLDDGP